MHESCDHCGLRYQREPGYFLGSIYFNYGLTAPIVWPLALFCLLFPLWFFRYARSLWLGFDHFFDARRET
jgi:hypothetical protein